MVEGKEGLLIYGATGHTGKLVASKAQELGIKSTLAGRNSSKLKKVAEETGLPYEVFDLQDKEKLESAVKRHVAVLHIAGPFTVTSPPMLEACLKQRTHYIDITGELGVIESIKSRDEEAKKRNIMLLPAAAFDVVPGDCLAAHLKRKLPEATHLDLITFVTRFGKGSSGAVLPSHGTMLSAALHIIPGGGLVKKNGQFVKESIGASTRKFETGDGSEPVTGFSFPAAELLCTSHSTKIPNINVYIPGKYSTALKPLQFMGPDWVNWWPIKKAVELAIAALPHPDETKVKDMRMLVAAEARDATSGKSVAASISTGPGYTFSANSACEIARRAVNGQFKPGFQSPASAYGPDLIMEIPGEAVERIDI